MINDIVARLSLDPGQRTLGQLIQDREAAAQEIRRLRVHIERLGEKPRSAKPADNHDVPAPAYPAGALLRLGEVCKLLGVSRSTIYKRMALGSFPPPVRVSDRAVRWRLADVEGWRDSLPPWTLAAASESV